MSGVTICCKLVLSQIKNEDIKELQIFDLDDILKYYKRRWKERLERMSSDSGSTVMARGLLKTEWAASCLSRDAKLMANFSET